MNQTSQDKSKNTQGGEPHPIHHTKNLYPTVRHTVLIIFVLVALFMIVFLVNENGRRIYENGH